MPHFFFNIHDGTSILDEEGTELAGWQEAQVEATKLAGRILTDGALALQLGENWRVEVADEAGVVLFRLDLFVSAAPASTSLLKAGVRDLLP